jgi:hypothetical protein
MFRQWRRGYIRKDDYDGAFQVASGEPEKHHIRAFTDKELHRWLTSGNLSNEALSMAQSELRRREASTSQKWTLAIAALTLLVAIFGFVAPV